MTNPELFASFEQDIPQFYRKIVMDEHAQDEFIPPNVNRRTGVKRPNDKFLNAYEVRGVKFNKTIVIPQKTQELIDKIWPFISTEEYSVDNLRLGFYHVHKVLDNLFYLSTSIPIKRSCVTLSAFFNQGCKLYRINTSNYEDSFYQESRKTEAMYYWLKYYKAIFKYVCSGNNIMCQRLQAFYVSTSQKPYEVSKQLQDPLHENNVDRFYNRTVPREVKKKLLFQTQMLQSAKQKIVDVASDQVKDVIFSTFKKVFSSLPDLITSSLKDGLSSGKQIITSLVVAMTTFFEGILTGSKDLFSNVVGYLPTVSFNYAFTAFLAFFSLYFMRDTLIKYSNIVSQAIFLTIRKVGYNPDSSFVTHLNKLFSYGKKEFETQMNIATLVPVFGTVLACVFSSQDKSYLMSGNAVVNFCSRLPQAYNTLEESLCAIFDYLYFNFLSDGKHLFKDREHFDTVRKFCDDFTQFSNVPGDLQVFIRKSLSKARELQKLYRRALEIEPTLLTFKNSPTLQNALIRVITEIKKLQSFATVEADLYKTRIETPLLWLYGKPGQGKTTCSPHLVAAIYQLLNSKLMPTDDSFSEPFHLGMIHNRAKESVFWEGYAQHFCCFWNEAFAGKDAKDRSRIAQELLTACEDGVYPLNMAFDSKGKAFFNSYLALITSNISEEDVEGRMNLTDPSALIRRRTLHLEVMRADPLVQTVNKADGSIVVNYDEAWIFRLRVPKTKNFELAFQLGTPKMVRDFISNGFIDLNFSQVVHIMTTEILHRMVVRDSKRRLLNDFDYSAYVSAKPFCLKKKSCKPLPSVPEVKPPMPEPSAPMPQCDIVTPQVDPVMPESIIPKKEDPPPVPPKKRKVVNKNVVEKSEVIVDAMLQKSIDDDFQVPVQTVTISLQDNSSKSLEEASQIEMAKIISVWDFIYGNEWWFKRFADVLLAYPPAHAFSIPTDDQVREIADGFINMTAFERARYEKNQRLLREDEKVEKRQLRRKERKNKNRPKFELQMFARFGKFCSSLISSNMYYDPLGVDDVVESIEIVTEGIMETIPVYAKSLLSCWTRNERTGLLEFNQDEGFLLRLNSEQNPILSFPSKCIYYCSDFSRGFSSIDWIDLNDRWNNPTSLILLANKKYFHTFSQDPEEGSGDYYWKCVLAIFESSIFAKDKETLRKFPRAIRAVIALLHVVHKDEGSLVDSQKHLVDFLDNLFKNELLEVCNFGFSFTRFVLNLPLFLEYYHSSGCSDYYKDFLPVNEAMCVLSNYFNPGQWTVGPFHPKSYYSKFLRLQGIDIKYSNFFEAKAFIKPVSVELESYGSAFELGISARNALTNAVKKTQDMFWFLLYSPWVSIASLVALILGGLVGVSTYAHVSSEQFKEKQKEELRKKIRPITNEGVVRNQDGTFSYGDKTYQVGFGWLHTNNGTWDGENENPPGVDVKAMQVMNWFSMPGNDATARGMGFYPETISYPDRDFSMSMETQSPTREGNPRMSSPHYYVQSPTREGNPRMSSPHYQVQSPSREGQPHMQKPIFQTQSSHDVQLANLGLHSRTLVFECGTPERPVEIEGFALFSGRRAFFAAHAHKALASVRMIHIKNKTILASFYPHQVRITTCERTRDLMYIDFPKSFSEMPSLSKKLYSRSTFPSATTLLSAPITRLHITSVDNKIVISEKSRNGALKMTDPINGSTSDAKYSFNGGYIMQDIPGKPGDCGLPYLITDPTGVVKVLGIHVGFLGSNGVGDSYFTPIFTEDFMTEGFQTQGAYIPPWLEFAPYNGGTVYDDQIQWMGTLKKPKMIPKDTNILPSVAQKHGGLGDLYPVTQFPGILHSTSYIDSQGFLHDIRPLKYRMDKLNAAPCRPFPSGFSHLMLHEFERLYDGFFPRKYEKGQLRRWSIEEAIFGIPGLWQGLSDDTAVGYDIEVLLPPHERLNGRKDLWNKETGFIHPIIYRLVEEYDQAVRDGYSIKNIVFGCLKDEVRPDPEKPRLFFGGSLGILVWTITWVGSLVVLSKGHRGQTSVAIGTNPHGFDWKALYHMLTALSECEFAAGDISGQDMSERSWWGFVLGHAFCAQYGYPAGSFPYNCVFNACTAALAPLLVIYDQLYYMDYLNSSGGWLTGVLNSFVSVCCFNFCLIVSQEISSNEEYKKEHKRDITRGIFYGDDNFWSFKKKYASEFNMVILARLTFHYFGIKYTTPEKTEITEPFSKFEDLEFLKRKFRVDGTDVFAPLAEESIRSMLLWIRTPKNEEGTRTTEPLYLEQQWLINVETAAQEWFHYGRERFEQECFILAERCRQLGLTYTGKPYEHYLGAYLRGFI